MHRADMAPAGYASTQVVKGSAKSVVKDVAVAPDTGKAYAASSSTEPVKGKGKACKDNAKGKKPVKGKPPAPIEIVETEESKKASSDKKI